MYILFSESVTYKVKGDYVYLEDLEFEDDVCDVEDVEAKIALIIRYLKYLHYISNTITVPAANAHLYAYWPFYCSPGSH